MLDNDKPGPAPALDKSDLEALTQQIEDRISNHRGWYIFEALVFLIVGALAILLPGVTAFAVEILIAALLLVTGGVQVILFFSRGGAWWRVLSGLLSIAVGGGMLAFPVIGITALALLIGAFLILEGCVEITMSLTYKPFRNWWWLMLSGVLALIVGGLVFAFLPVAGVLYIALAVGLNMILYGLSLLILSFRAGQSGVGGGKQHEKPA